MEKFYCVVLLVTICGLVTESSCNSLVGEKQLAGRGIDFATKGELSEVKQRLEKMESDIESINEAVVKLVFALLENKPEGTEKVHDVKRREVISDNPLTNLPYGDLSGLVGAPGKDGQDGIDGLPGVVGLPGKDGIAGPVGLTGPIGPAGHPGAAGKDGKSAEAGGAVYSRWGRTTCGYNSILLYAGYAGNSNYNQPGGGTNMQCMPLDPKYNKQYNGVGTWWGSYMAGVEYETLSYGIFPDSAFNQNVPCARCYTNNRSALMMIPAKRDCSEGWNKEYEGYLMANHYIHNHQTTFECVDENPEYVNGEGADTNGGTVHFIRTQCNRGGHCPPYDGNKEMTCVVCSK